MVESIFTMRLDNEMESYAHHEPVSIQRAVLALGVTKLAHLARTAPGADWDEAAERFQYYVQCEGLFGIFAALLMAVVVNQPSLTICNRCGHAYPSDRSPRYDRAHYCDRCAPEMQRQWKRESARRARERKGPNRCRQRMAAEGAEMSSVADIEADRAAGALCRRIFAGPERDPGGDPCGLQPRFCGGRSVAVAKEC